MVPVYGEPAPRESEIASHNSVSRTQTSNIPEYAHQGGGHPIRAVVAGTSGQVSYVTVQQVVGEAVQRRW